MILPPMPSGTEGKNNAGGGSGKSSSGHGVFGEGGSGKVKKERARERWRGLEEGGVWSPSGQSPYGMEADPTALPRLAEA